MLRSLGARLVSFVPQTVATLVLARLIIGVYGLDSFSAFSLMLALIYLLPLRSLGVGVAVTTALAIDGPGSKRSDGAVLAALRALTIAALVTSALAAAVTAFDLWPRLLGQASGPNLLYGVGVIVFAISIVPGLSTDVLLGVDRNHVAIIGQAMITPVAVLMVGALILFHAPWQLTLVCPPLAMLVVNVVLARMAGRPAGIRWASMARRLPQLRQSPGGRIRATAGPMLVVGVVSPIATQLDRIILSHVSTSEAVAAYALTVQLFAPAVALFSAVSAPLWPVYVAAHADGKPGPSIAKLAALFTLAGLVGAAVLVPLSRLLAGVVGDGKVDIGWSLPLAGGAWIILLAIAAPIAAIMMDPPGLRRMAVYSVLGLPVNLALSIILARHIGGAGPLWGSDIVLALPVVPFLLYALRRQRRVARTAEAPTSEALTPEGAA